MKSFDNILLAQLLVTLFKYFIVKLFELALSTVTVKMLLIPHSNKQLSIAWPIVSPLLLET
jgi:hypothetical protein